MGPELDDIVSVSSPGRCKEGIASFRGRGELHVDGPLKPRDESNLRDQRITADLVEKDSRDKVQGLIYYPSEET